MSKKLKRPAVQLTSLLDLLFVMIFVSLMQTKSASVTSEAAKNSPTETAPVVEDVQVSAPPSEVTVNAIFHFYATPRSSSIPSGMYAMRGVYDQATGELSLGGHKWLQRPEGYDMVPLSGTIDQESDTFTGAIEFQGCEEFNLYRSSSKQGSPIAGKWEGVYNCSQGETGLTLTIK